MSNQNFKVRKGIDAGDIINAPVFNSTVATGTAPLTVVSTTVVTNLNADLLDGMQPSALPVSSATQSALNLKANIASPTFSGQVILPEGSSSAPGLTFSNDSSNTGFYHTSDGVFGATCGSTPVATFLASGVNLLKTPTAPTATVGTSTTQIATTAFVAAAATLKSDLVTTVTKDSSTGAAFMPSGTTAQRPTSPVNGYMRYNSDLLAMEAYVNGSWGSVGGGATGGGTDHVFNNNGYVVTSNYTIPAGMSAVTVGDSNGNVTINSGVTVTVSNGSRWVVL
jgi:hypothetical protein